MILADTSVWVDYFNGVANTYTDRLDSELDSGGVAIGDIILLEILQGFKKNKDFEVAKKTLQVLDQYELFGHSMVLKCAENYRTLRKKGITVRKTADVIIATFCIENHMPLLFTDRDFKPFVDNLGLTDATQQCV